MLCSGVCIKHQWLSDNIKNEPRVLSAVLRRSDEKLPVIVDTRPRQQLLGLHREKHCEVGNKLDPLTHILAMKCPELTTSPENTHLELRDDCPSASCLVISSCL